MSGFESMKFKFCLQETSCSLNLALISNNEFKSLTIPFLLIVLIGDAIIYDLLLTAIPIFLSPKSITKRVCDVLCYLIKILGLII